MAKDTTLDPFTALSGLIPDLTDLYSAVKAKKGDKADGLCDSIIARI